MNLKKMNFHPYGQDHSHSADALMVDGAVVDLVFVYSHQTLHW